MIDVVLDGWQQNSRLLLVMAGVSLLGASAGLIGCFAVLRRRALTGDALAHAALPGLCLSYLTFGSTQLPALLAGAFAAGLAGVAVIAALRRWTRIKEDAAIGIVLTVFFGAGVVLSQQSQARAGLQAYILGSTAAILGDDLLWLLGLSLVTLLAVLLLYKEFQLVAFDASFAQAQGWPVYRLDLLLTGMIALAVVIGLPTAGVLMIAALLITPAAAARFWTDRLDRMLLLSALFGAGAGIAGAQLSDLVRNMPTGPAIILFCAALFVVSALLAPRRGLVARAVENWRFRRELRHKVLQSPGYHEPV